MPQTNVSSTRRARFFLFGGLFLALLVAVLMLWLVWHFVATRSAVKTPAAQASAPAATGSAAAEQADDLTPTNVYAHNLELEKGPDFRIYIPWIRGQLLRTHRNVIPSFDDESSFVLSIQKGVIHVNIGDLANFFNSGAVPNAPLTKVSLAGNGEQITLHGDVHKLIPLPIEVVGNFGVTPDGRVKLHVTKLDVLKIPLKGLLGVFHISLADLIRPNVPGVQIKGNDIYFDTETLLPAPHIRGQLTGIRVQNPDLVAVYGNAKNDPTRERQWHNFLQLSDGTLDFGKLTMHHVDLIMIDASTDPWFDLDLVHYQAQLVNGMTRMTPQAGLQIFMPDLDEMTHKKADQTITMEWLKNRNLPPPAGIPTK